MKGHIEHQIIKHGDKPLFVLVPYNEYVKLKYPGKKVYLPNEVVRRHALEKKSLMRAWREYKGYTQKEMASKVGISQSAYAQMEKLGKQFRQSTLTKIADVLDIQVEQLQI